MTADLPGLVRHIARLFVLGSLLTTVMAVGTWLADGNAGDSREFSEAVVVLATLAGVQLLFWFGLVYWADLAIEQPAPDTGVDDYR